MLHPVMVSARSVRASRAALLIAFVALAAPRVARADDAAAAALAEGKRLMAAGKTAEACPKLAESQKLAPDLGTLLALADCNAALGKTATAWRTYRDAADAAAAAKDPREAAARRKIAELAPRVGRLVVHPPNGAKSSLAIACDGEVIPFAAWRTEVPLDPGPHRVTASTLVGSTWATQIVVAPEGGLLTVKIPDEVIGQGQPGEKPMRSSGGSRDDDERTEEDAAAATQNPGNTQRIVGIIVGGAGVVGLGLGTFFGLTAKSKLDDSNDGHCSGNLCDATGVQLRSDYSSAARLSTVTFLAGGALLAGGAVLFFTAPRAPVTATVAGGPDGTHVVLRGTF